eukprot:3796064-Pyramimonas_sp.AAC.1
MFCFAGAAKTHGHNCMNAHIIYLLHGPPRAQQLHRATLDHKGSARQPLVCRAPARTRATSGHLP